MIYKLPITYRTKPARGRDCNLHFMDEKVEAQSEFPKIMEVVVAALGPEPRVQSHNVEGSTASRGLANSWPGSLVKMNPNFTLAPLL